MDFFIIFILCYFIGKVPGGNVVNNDEWDLLRSFFMDFKK